MDYGIVIFVDIRGFTEWSEDTDVNSFLSALVTKFYSLLEKQFSADFVKMLGDGAMIIKDCQPSEASKLIKDIVQRIEECDKDFEDICKNFESLYGKKTDLYLGWGITRGKITKVPQEKNRETDYIGATINRAARLCDFARPFGMVIDKYNFDSLKDDKRFIVEKFYLRGVSNPTECFISQTISYEYIPREMLRESPEVHVAGFCYRHNENGEVEILLSKRNKDRVLFPDLLEGCGGQLRNGESFVKGVKRHYLSEMRVTVDIPNVNDHLLYEIKSNNGVISGIVFKCKYVDGTPESLHHSEQKWYTLKQIDNIPEDRFIPKVKEEIKQLFE